MCFVVVTSSYAAFRFRRPEIIDNFAALVSALTEAGENVHGFSLIRKKKNHQSINQSIRFFFVRKKKIRMKVNFYFNTTTTPPK